MPSIIEGYNYDIFISYRQKDNKGDRWVSQFVEALKTELESTFKEEISIYFDINPHDGLLETHDVDESLKEKLKCLIFVPIISRTYCDPKSFAWENELKAFVDEALKEEYGLKVKLPNGNIASRVLPIVVHDLDVADLNECESVLGGTMRGIDFIYKEPGVNRPLTPTDDSNTNLNNTSYRNQINKSALAIREVISGLTKKPSKITIESTEKVLLEDKPAIKEKSIIVLPFEDISPSKDNEYFSDGLTEEIITDLSHIDDLLVISRSSAMTFKETKKTIPEIAQSVKVRYVLEGSVRKAGNNLRITAQLIDALTDTHIWADKYTGILDDIFNIQENVSRKIIEAIKGRISPSDIQQIITDQYSNNAGVFEAYSRAHYEIWRYEPGCLERALRLLEEARQAFGEHPLLLSGIGAIHWQFYHQLGDIDEIHLEKVKEYSARLFDIDPLSATGHRLQSYIDLHNGNIDVALRHLSKSMEGDPGDTETLLWLSYLLAIHAGQTALAKPVAERWLAIDPLQPLSKMSVRLIEWMDGDYENAIKGMKDWKEQDPENPIPAFYLGHVLAWTGRHDESLMLAEEMFRRDPDEGMGQALRFISYALHGDKKKAENTITPSTKEWLWMDFHLPWLIAEGYSIMEKNDEAMLWLERAIEKGFFNYPMLNEQDPLLINIRSDKRFKKLMEKVKYKWENFEI